MECLSFLGDLKVTEVGENYQRKERSRNVIQRESKKAAETVEVISMPETQEPSGPVKSIKGPRLVQLITILPKPGCDTGINFASNKLPSQGSDLH